MLATQRQDRILADVQAHGAVRVTDLVAALDVSDMTVRRDIGELARRGLVRRGHGGAAGPRATRHRAGVAPKRAAPPPAPAPEPEFATKRFLAADQKAAIARAALAWVTPGCAISVSAGTTAH